MPKYYEFVEIFETSVLEGSYQKVVLPSVKIELLPRLPRRYQVSREVSRIVPRGRDVRLAESAGLELLAPSAYIVLTARTLEQNPQEARDGCKREVDRAVALLSLALKPTIFGRRIHSGWVQNERGFFADAWFRSASPLAVPAEGLQERTSSMLKAADADSEKGSRLSLMATLYSRSAIDTIPSEANFLGLWMVLEVYPMVGTSNIKPVSEVLARIVGTGVSPDSVHTKLGIGHLFGERSNIVHDGRSRWPLLRLANEFSKLEHICLETMRSIVGLPYSGSLDKYLADGSSVEGPRPKGAR